MSEDTREAGIDAMKSMQAWQFEVARLLLKVALLEREVELLTEQLEAEIKRSRTREPWWDESLAVNVRS